MRKFRFTRGRRPGLILSLFILGSFQAPAADSSVKISRQTLIIPTYLAGEPEHNPIFYFGRAYQGAKGHVYPYPLLDVLTDVRQNKAYEVLYLENEYLKIGVLPAVGGRIFEAQDKTNGYHFFYRQHVIKPALIGMLGAWISGGVEWNIPHHHRATTFMPVDWASTENPDGSKTVWVGEIELRHRLKWIVGLTLRPSSSLLEVTYRIFNRTPFAHPILCWANAAVHANENYQVIFPPSTRLAAFHGKNQFAHWPISHEVYNGVDYTRGVDISWWKNHPAPTSFFAVDSKEDFFAGYDHGRRAGVVFVADHNLVCGKKLWTWGTGNEGKRWEKILTDADGPYLELMFGSFSDNQPDYSWCQPYEVKTVTQSWYPLREIGAAKNANTLAACNLEVEEGRKAFIGVCVSSPHQGAKVLLTKGDKTIFVERAEISPDHPFTAEISLPEEAPPETLRLSLVNEEGKEIISYQQALGEEPPLPEPVTAPPPPETIKTNEELFLTGLRLEQFYNPAFEPYPYYEEALRRDPDDARVNTALGRLYLMRGMNDEAESRLRRAVVRLSKHYTRPKDGEALYYLGLALRAQEKEKEAFESLARASWSEAWSAAAQYEMAELAARRGSLEEALELVERSLSKNRLNTRALNLGTVILRNMERLPEAEKWAREAQALDPLDHWAANEIALIKEAQKLNEETGELPVGLKQRMRDDVQNYLELAAGYGRSGFIDEAIDVLSNVVAAKGKTSFDPLVYYDLAFYWHQKGREDLAKEFCSKASRLPPDYCFPFRLESLDVLRWARSINPQDPRAPYYLGNLLFDFQPGKAIQEWEESKKLDETFATVHRNLGLAYARVKNDILRAVGCLERAVTCNPKDPRLYLELDELYDLADIDPQKRLALLTENHEVVARRDDAISREIALLADLGDYEKAIEVLKSHHFHIWEGGGEIHDVWVEAHLLRGQKHLRIKQPEKALRDFEAALEYPENLEVGKPAAGGRSPEIFYFIGMANESLGESEKAQDAFAQSAQAKVGPSESTFYQGLSWRKLGEPQKAAAAFERLIGFGRENLEKGPARDYFAKFGEKESVKRRQASYHYLCGLGLLGRGQRDEAKAEFQKALALRPHYPRAKRQLESAGS